ncbi:uncharacterized protein VTP21DRAFT_9208 [Calcarisporiella thermophila]|uniref:uncharacterized protein n=1 Tax=Calcarisporiella thermophila TaxID=911321 RepID=UPI003743D669
MKPIGVLMLTLQGATVALCTHALIYCLHIGRPATLANIAKVVLSVTLGIKVIGFITFSLPLFGACYGVAKAADLLYHLSMVAANLVLLSRATTIWNNTRVFKAIEAAFLAVRLGLGLWDVAVTYAYPVEGSPDNVDARGTCFYVENFHSGLAYLSMDLLTDLYVTTSISIRLFQHHRHMKQSGVGANSLYSAIISSNLLRTVILLMINIVSIVLIAIPNLHTGSVFVWSFANIAYVITVVYDSDMVRFCQQLQAEVMGIRSSRLNSKGGSRVEHHSGEGAYATKESLAEKLSEDMLDRV